MNNNSLSVPKSSPPVPGQRPRGSVKWAMPLLAILAIAAPFLGAGTLAWPAAWLYIVLTTVASVASRALMLRAHPELEAERAAFVANEGTKSWDRVIAPVVIFGPTIIAFVAGLNYRFGWPPAIALALQVLALAIVGASLVFASWAMISNPFFSSVVRVQSERGHHAIAGGPYRFVRHPAYAATVSANLAIALMLGSAWALIPAALVSALVVLRTALEDRSLRAELQGYREYATQVRHRLFPGVW
jgi:protein-S-isoprenylcysteine O-methyltransferase Ste14